ncbi:MAG: N-acetyl-gamma-glutamyl-phosphate reductase [Chromatiales bacterium]|nr:N-acetyl-gamma-glutamyl-phosphate reductase [Chromatiales bacterium]
MHAVAIIGGGGYTGYELTRLLLHHPQVKLTQVISRTYAGRAIAEVHPRMTALTDLHYSDVLQRDLNPDLVFFATPNGTAMQHAETLLDAGIRLIDMAADFRLRDVSEWQHWYGTQHTCPHLLDKAVYGISEINRNAIAAANLVANPGCYPTSAILGLKPLLESGYADTAALIIDAKSGVSGAGRQANVELLFSECSENFRAYKASGHRHWPEIRQQLNQIAGTEIGLSFTPHLLPIVRGLQSTMYIKTTAELEQLQQCLEQAYRQEAFVHVMPPDSHPQTGDVSRTNNCLIAVHKPAYGDIAIIFSVIDNLIKGAAGQAVQNMNLMLGLDETTGLIDLY